jgi:ABC-2 type transport system ATP-binding protein
VDSEPFDTPLSSLFTELPPGREQDSLAIDIENLSRSFEDQPAVVDLSLRIRTGEVFGLLGHNGAGKTTTIRMLTGLINPTSGMCRVLGMDPRTSGSEIRSRTGVLTETPALDSRMTGKENLQFFAEFFNIEPNRAHQRIEFLIDAFELQEYDQARVATYSRGLHQRLALARAMLHEPELLLLDEPTPGLDPVATRIVHLMIRAFRSEGGTVLLCTHNLEEAERLCDRVGVLERGRLLAVGNPAELTQRITDQQVEIEIASRFRDRAMRAISEALPDVRIATNDHVVRVDGLPRDRIPELVEALAGAKVPVYRVEPRGSSLEDVYFALHERGVPE